MTNARTASSRVEPGVVGASGLRLGRDRMARLLEYAAMAPSARGARPWTFRIGDDTVDLVADPSRLHPVPITDRRELHLSLGAALENLTLAGEHFGYRVQTVYFPEAEDPDLVARLTFSPAVRTWQPPLFAAVPERRTERGLRAGSAVDSGVLLDLAAIAWDPGIWGWASAAPELREPVAELVARADRIEFSEPEFRAELRERVDRRLLRLPGPLNRLAAHAAARMDLGPHVARRDAQRVRTAGGILVILSTADDAITQVRAGQAMERVWLLATRLGVAMQPMSQPLHIPELRRELAELVGAEGRHAQFLFRIVGRARRVRQRSRFAGPTRRAPVEN